MRETRLYGSEGGEAKAFPTPITLATLRIPLVPTLCVGMRGHDALRQGS